MPSIFLSHITEEADLVSAYRREIDERFLGMVEVFQSSDSGSMPVGRNWLDNITNALRGCEAMLLFCSPYSVKRPWINFECGAGWSRNIQVVPICHSGLRPVELPVPISLLQGVEATDGPGLQQVFEMIAGKLGSKVPKIEQTKLVKHAQDFSREYVVKRDLGDNVAVIASELDDHLLGLLKSVPIDKVTPITEFPMSFFERIRRSLDALQATTHLDYAWTTGSIILDRSPYSGQRGTLTVRVSQSLHDVLAKATR